MLSGVFLRHHIIHIEGSIKRIVECLLVLSANEVQTFIIIRLSVSITSSR